MTTIALGAVLYAVLSAVSMRRKRHTSAIIVIQNSDVSGLPPA